MSRMLRLGLWLLLTMVVVWAVVIGYWKVTGTRPDVRDLVLYLGVLPLGTFAVLALLRRGLQNAGSKASERQADAEGEGSGPEAGKDETQVRPATPVAILAGALRLPAGGDAAGVLGAIASPAAPELHPKLKDGSGFPVFASWVDDIDTDAVLQALEAAGASDADIRRFADEQLRGLGLLLPVAQDLLAQVVAEDWLAPPATAAATGGRGAPPPAPRLHASIFLPSDWPAALRGPVAAWFAEEARATGLDAGQLAVDALPATAGDDIWRHLAGIAPPASGQAPGPALHLVLACHSQLGERSVQRLDQGGRLLSAMRNEGIVPGEGAAGLVLHAADAQGGFAFPARAVLQAHTTEHQGVSWQPRAAIGQIQALLDRTLAGANGLAVDEVTALLSDADLRRSRATAAAGFFGQSLAHLDPDEDCLASGARCGHVGIVSPLALIALATERVAAGTASVLALALAEPDQRALALVASPVPPAAEDAAASSSKPQAT